MSSNLPDCLKKRVLRASNVKTLCHVFVSFFDLRKCFVLQEKVFGKDLRVNDITDRTLVGKPAQPIHPQRRPDVTGPARMSCLTM